MIPEDMDLLAALARQRAGLRIESDKAYLVESRLNPLARREGFDSIEAMIAALRSHREDRLIWAVVEALTLNETAFFRDREVFAQLRDELLPTLSKLAPKRPIRIWSAACSTGQEVYSLAMTAAEARDIAPGARFEFFGSDISDRCLEKAQSGLYTQFEVQRGLPITMMVKHFEKVDEMWRISPKLRSSIRFKKMNLLEDLRSVGRQDVIYCRNVLIYFDLETKKRVLEQMATLLADDGCLFLGAAETVLGITDAFKPMPGMRGLYVKNQASAQNAVQRSLRGAA